MEIQDGFVFQFEHGTIFTVIFMTDDGYYCLCEAQDGEHQIYATDSIEGWIKDGTAKHVRNDNIKTVIKTTRLY